MPFSGSPDKDRDRRASHRSGAAWKPVGVRRQLCDGSGVEGQLAGLGHRHPGRGAGVAAGPRIGQARREGQVGHRHDPHPRVAARIAVTAQLLEVHPIERAVADGQQECESPPPGTGGGLLCGTLYLAANVMQSARSAPTPTVIAGA
jgi:hypothetical protein